MAGLKKRTNEILIIFSCHEKQRDKSGTGAILTDKMKRGILWLLNGSRQTFRE